MTEEKIAVRPIDLGESIKKLSKKDVMLIARAIYSKGALTPQELREETGLTQTSFNHAITEMNQADLVIKEAGRYYLTRYSATLLGALDQLRSELKREDGTSLFSPLRPGTPTKNKNHQLITA